VAVHLEFGVIHVLAEIRHHHRNLEAEYVPVDVVGRANHAHQNARIVHDKIRRAPEVQSPDASEQHIDAKGLNFVPAVDEADTRKITAIPAELCRSEDVDVRDQQPIDDGGKNDSALH
jgi:hypothetical protein